MSPLESVEQLSPLTFAPAPRTYSLDSPTAPPPALFPPNLDVFPPDSPINYERVAPQLSPHHSPIVSPHLTPRLRYPSPTPAPPSPQTPGLQYLRPVATQSVHASPSPPPDYPHAEQENVPPRANPFQNPPCTRRNLARSHPHQFLVLQTRRDRVRDNWRPLHETNLADIVSHIPLASDLATTRPPGAFVTPFRLPAVHTTRVHPANQRLAERHNFPHVVLCSSLGVYQPDDWFPFGRLLYSFSHSLGTRFNHPSELIALTFVDSLIPLYIHDFLDGRHLFIYGYLDWNDEGLPIAKDVSFSFQDTLRSNPFLARYTLFPRLPFDPLAHVSPHEGI